MHQVVAINEIYRATLIDIVIKRCRIVIVGRPRRIYFYSVVHLGHSGQKPRYRHSTNFRVVWLAISDPRGLSVVVLRRYFVAIPDDNVRLAHVFRRRVLYSLTENGIRDNERSH